MELKKVKYIIVPPFICHEVMEPDAMISFLNVEFEASIFTFLFHFNQEALWFLLTFFHKGGVIHIPEVIDISAAILIPACASSSQAFHIMYCAYKLDNQGDSIQP